MRISLKTRDLQRAARRLTEIEDRVSGKPRKTIVDAVAAFHAHRERTAPRPNGNTTRILGYLVDFSISGSIHYLGQISVEGTDRYAKPRAKESWGWIKEIELLRQFFEGCRDRSWIPANAAKHLKRPIIREADNVAPYAAEEIIRIISTCDQIGRNSYERRRARARLLMRYAGLRISDVVTLSRDHIKGTRLEKRAVKNHRLLRVELPPVVLTALDVLPAPKAAWQDCRLFFSSGSASLRSLVKGAARTIAAVFKRSGVARAHCHRFRHTLASELLGKGGNLEVVAAILGDSPATIRRYYAKWTPEYQSRQDDLIRTIHGTDLAQAEEQASKC